jgi:sigma-E factor negative regulatory protein RseB
MTLSKLSRTVSVTAQGLVCLFAAGRLGRLGAVLLACVLGNSLFSPLVLASSERMSDSLLSAQQWLDAMAKAQSERDYHGVFTYEHGAEMASMEVWHAFVDGVEHERLLHLDGEPREVVRKGESLTCLHQGRKNIKLEHQFAPVGVAQRVERDFTRLALSYDSKVIGRYRVAGHEAMVIELEPRDVYRYGQRFYISETDKLLLKGVLFDQQRRALERFQFAFLKPYEQLDESLLQARLDLDVSTAGVDDSNADGSNADAPDDLNVESESRLRETGGQAQRDSTVSQSWQVTWVPMGFEAVASVTARSGMPVRDVGAMYSDGLVGFSVFLDSVKGLVNGAPEPVSHLQRGATLVYSRPLLTTVGEYRVTVVGEVPLKAAERIAASVQLE